MIQMRRRSMLRMFPAGLAAACHRSSPQAPDFELLELSGRYIRLSDWNGSRVLLTFWTTSCGICRRELPQLYRLRLEFGSQGVAVVTVCGDSRENATAFLNQNGLDLITAIDPGFEVFREFGVSGVPATFLLDAQHLVRKRWTGGAAELIRRTLSEI
jgi:peroxiredoxin